MCETNICSTSMIMEASSVIQSEYAVLTMENTKAEMLAQLKLVIAENAVLKNRVQCLEDEVESFRRKLSTQDERQNMIGSDLNRMGGILNGNIKEENYEADESGHSVASQASKLSENDDNVQDDVNLLGTCLSNSEEEQSALNEMNMMNDQTEMPNNNHVIQSGFNTSLEDKKFSPDHGTCALDDVCSLNPTIVSEVQDLTLDQSKIQVENIVESKRHVCVICNRVYQKAHSLHKHMARHSGHEHQCDKCTKTFKTHTSLKMHQRRMHEGFKPPKEPCSVCGKLVQNMQQHKLSHSSDRSFICFVCGMEFKTNAHCKRHMKLHENESNMYKCTECEKLFDNENSLRYHMRVHRGNNLFYCVICCVSFESATEYLEHKETHAAEKPFSCLSCGKRFKEQIELDNHIPVHSNGATRCSICDKQFVSVASKKTHMLVHKGEKPHHCDQCNKYFLTKRTLRRHMVKHKDRPKCDRCGNTYASLDALRKHIERIHEGLKGKQHCCQICGKSFEQITQHMLSHSQERSFKCSVCGAGFTRIQHLDRHKIIHSGERPFPCSLCNKSYRRSSDLKAHVVTHSGERPHKCTICDASFVQYQGLRRHEACHSGLRPYGCNTCGRRFKQNVALKHHILTHTGERPHSCPLCGKTFSRDHHVKTHIKLIHEKPSPSYVFGS